MIEIVSGIVIKENTYKDSSKIIEVFTKNGIISIIARGAKKIKSPLFAGTTYLSYANFCIYKRNISILKSVDIINSFKNSLKDINKISASSYLINLSTQVYKQNNNSNIYDILISSLEKIDQNINPLGIINIAETKFLDYLGVSLNLDSCVLCGNNDVCYLSIEHAGYLCSNCSNVTMDKKILKLIRLYYYVDINKIDNLDVNKDILLNLNKFITEYYEKYTGLFLNSKNFFMKVFEN